MEVFQMKTLLRYICGAIFTLALVAGLKINANYKIICVKEHKTLGNPSPSIDNQIENRYHTSFSTRTDAAGSTGRCYVRFNNNEDITMMHPSLAIRMNLGSAPNFPGSKSPDLDVPRSVYIVKNVGDYEELIKQASEEITKAFNLIEEMLSSL